MYSSEKIIKVLWESLDEKYKGEHINLKELIIGKFVIYKIVGSKFVMSQFQEFLTIIK